MKKYETISVAAMPEKLDQEKALLLDCRLLKDYRKEHIENAMHAHDDLVEILIREADKATPLVIYCYHGHNSEHLADLFASFGFQRVYSVEGGYAKWQEIYA